MKQVIETYALSKEYGGEFKVNNVDLKVPEEKVYGFLGPNGAGKSTTLKMVLGLVKPTRGEVDLFGQRLNAKNRLQILSRVGSLIESPSYYGHLTGRENLKIIQTLLQVPPSHINKVLEIVRLEKQQDKQVGHYSLGMKQRLGIASAMLAFPPLLVLDEPTNGLDPAGIQEMRELILSLPKQCGMTILVSSHLLAEIDQIADTVGIIHRGKLVYQDNLTALHQKGKKQIAVRTKDNNAAKRLLKEHGVQTYQEDDFLVMDFCSDEKVAEQNTILVQNRIPVVRIEQRSKSLEDIFLEITGTAVSL